MTPENERRQELAIITGIDFRNGVLTIYESRIVLPPGAMVVFEKLETRIEPVEVN